MTHEPVQVHGPGDGNPCCKVYSVIGHRMVCIFEEDGAEMEQRWSGTEAEDLMMVEEEEEEDLGFLK